MRQTSLLLILLIGGLGAALNPTGALSQECVTFQSIPATASFRFNGPSIISGASPARYCSLLPGVTYRLRIESRAHETRTLKFKLNKAGEISTSSNALSYSARSLIIPGWGQYLSGRSDRGGWALTLGVGSLAYLGFAAYDYTEAKDEFDRIKMLLDEADNQDDIEQLTLLASTQSKQANTERQYLIEVGVFAGYVHLANITETWLMNMGPGASTADGIVTVSTPKKTATRALMRSIFFPGMGQDYVGSHVKGYFLQATFLLTGVGILESRRDYREANDDYETSLIVLDNSQTVDEIEAARGIVNDKWDNRREKERYRNAWYIAAGSVWLINVIDAAFSGNLSRNNAPMGGVEFGTSMRGKEVRTGFRVRF